jgi:hypothetical protein
MTRANPQYPPAAATAAPVKAHNVVLVRHLPFANSPAKAPDAATAGQLSSSGPGFGIFGTTFRPVGEQ